MWVVVRLRALIARQAARLITNPPIGCRWQKTNPSGQNFTVLNLESSHNISMNRKIERKRERYREFGQIESKRKEREKERILTSLNL
jgi:hypothetical protein